MEDNKETTQQEGKLSYEKLNEICSQLYIENQKLTRQLQGTGMMFKRLDYLFKALEFAGVIKDPQFIGDCVEEIKSALTIKQEDNKEE